MNAKLLEDANHRLEAGDRLAAFEAIRAAWRDCRCAELAALTTRAGQVLGDCPAFDQKSTKEWHAAWVARAQLGNPLDLSVLLASVVERADPRRTALVSTCLDQLAALADDPQLTLPLVALFAMPGGATSWAKVHTRILQLLDAAGDPRAIGELEAIVRDAKANPNTRPTAIQRSVLERAPKLIARLSERFEQAPKLPKALAKPISDLLTRLAGPLPAASTRPREAKNEEALLQAIYDEPDNDAPRQVYADVLQERSDPRGEFIALQMRSGDAAAAARAQRLLKEHRRAWLGPLAKTAIATSVEFERGFLSACATDVRRQAEAQVVFARPEWATVKRLTFGKYGHLSPLMRSLVEVHGVSSRMLVVLEKHAFPSLEILGISGRDSPISLDGDKPTSAGLKALASTKGLPSLREVCFERDAFWSSRELGADDYRWLLEAPFGAQLESLTVRIELKEAFASWVELLRSTPHLKKVSATRDINGVGVVLGKTDGTVTATVDVVGPYAAEVAKPPLWMRNKLDAIRRGLAGIPVNGP